MTAIVLGAGFGIGLALLAAWLTPARLSLAQTFAALHPTTPVLAATPASGLLTDEVPSRIAQLGRPFAPLLARLGLPRTSPAADLRICARDPARHVAEQAATGLAGFLIPPAFAALLTLGGIPISWQLPLWASLLVGAAGLWVPDLALASQASKRRIELRDAVSGMLDMVVISLAGGAGIEQALRDGTDDARGWAAIALRRAVESAHLRRQPPWQALGQLGTDTGLSALSELAAALSMAGSEGARIKATLAARSAALQTHQLAEAEAAALSATERMVLPMVGLLGGFMIFIVYPAFATILGAF